MIDLSKILDTSTTEDICTLDTGRGIKEDIVYWSNRFIKYISMSTSSKHTMRSYKFIIDSLIKFIEVTPKLSTTKNSLSDLSIATINEYFSFLEDYKTNSTYGLLETRLEILFRYSDEVVSCNTLEELKNLPNRLGDNFSIYECEVFEYMISSYSDFLKLNNIMPFKTNNSIIKKYIGSIEKISNKTMQQRKASLQSFMTYIDRSIKQEHFKSMYWEFNKYPVVKKNDNSKKGTFDKDTVTLLVSTLKNYPDTLVPTKEGIYKNSMYSAYKNSLMILIMMFGGARASEVVNIKYRDIDTFTSEKRGERYSIAVTGKGNKERVLYIDKEHLNKHIDYLLSNRGENDYISGKANSNEPLTTQALYAFSKKVFNLINIDKKGLHIFRHHFASNFVGEVGNIAILQDILGHSNINTTMIYSNVRDEQKREV